MRAVRRRTVTYAALCLGTQLAIFTAVPMAQCQGMSRAVAPAQCSCAHRAQPCPHGTSTGSNRTGCSCRGTNDETTAVLASLVGPVASLTQVSAWQAVSGTQPQPERAPCRPRDPHFVPDPPPPRA